MAGGRVFIRSLVAAAVLLIGGPAAAQTACPQPRPLHPRDPIDVFLIAGQSNASGIPDDAVGSPKVPPGRVLQYGDGRISDGDDPVGNAHPGSAWPAFGSAYYRKTGRRVMFVPAAVAASSIGAGADVFGIGHWDQTGKLFDIAVDRLGAAMRAAGPNAALKGVLWSQGESEALSINLGYETASRYETELKGVIAHFRAALGASTPFFIFQTGASPTAAAKGFDEVRAVQLDVSRTVRDAPVVFTGAVTFPRRGLMSRSGEHYSQAGYNEMGREGAEAVADFLQARSGAQCPP